MAFAHLPPGAVRPYTGPALFHGGTGGVNDVKLKIEPGHAGGRDWMAPASLRQLFWNVTYACNFACQVCFSNSGAAAPDELTTDEARSLIRNAADAGIKDIVISGGEPFLRDDMVELLACMAQFGITARIASNGRLLTSEIIDRLRRETLVKSFQISLDTLDRDVYEEIHGAPAEMLDAALAALRLIREAGFHTTVSTRLAPKTLPGIPALLDRAAQEGWLTVTVHCPVCTGRAEGLWPRGTDLMAALEPVFEHFVGMEKRWLVETNIPWARYHPAIRRLSRQVRVEHEGCGAARWRLAIGATGWISPCICVDLPDFQMGNVREDDLARLFAEAPLARLMRCPQEHGICTDCGNVGTCGGGCRAAAFAQGGRTDALDASCPVRRARERG